MATESMADLTRRSADQSPSGRDQGQAARLISLERDREQVALIKEPVGGAKPDHEGFSVQGGQQGSSVGNGCGEGPATKGVRVGSCGGRETGAEGPGGISQRDERGRKGQLSRAQYTEWQRPRSHVDEHEG